jgi:hypothetical protein
VAIRLGTKRDLSAARPSVAGLRPRVDLRRPLRRLRERAMARACLRCFAERYRFMLIEHGLVNGLPLDLSRPRQR